MSFFSRFFAVSKDIVNDIKNSQNGVSERRYSQNSVLCMKLIWTYMMSCKWHNTERTKRLMTFITLKDSEIAERLNIENNTVRCHKSNYSAKLYEKLGDDCFTIVCSSDERAKRNLILILYNKTWHIQNNQSIIKTKECVINGNRKTIWWRV